MLSLIIVAISVILFISTLLPISHVSHWVVRGLDFPRLQLSALLCVLLCVILIFGNSDSNLIRISFVLNIICLLYQLYWIRPYTIFSQKEVAQCKNPEINKSLVILCSNVLMPNNNFQSLIDKIRQHQPDIVVTLESDKRWEKALTIIESDYPYSVKCPQDNLYGIHLYSKLPLQDTQLHYLIEKDIPSIHCKLSLRSGDIVQAHFLHPAPPSPTENTYSSERDAELIIVADSIKKYTQPVVVTGDLNDVAWSKTTQLFRRLSGLKDPRIGRGMFNTFHADYWFMRWPLDHVFHSAQFDVCSIKRLKIRGSDHFALLTHLHLRTSSADTSPPKSLSQDEETLITQRMDEVT